MPEVTSETRSTAPRKLIFAGVLTWSITLLAGGNAVAGSLPVLADFQISPPAMADVTRGFGSVEIILRITDSDGDFDSGQISTVAIPTSAYFGSWNRISGDATDGIYHVPLYVGAYSQPGTFPLLVNLESHDGASYYGSGDDPAGSPRLPFPAGVHSEIAVRNPGPVDLQAPQLLSIQITPEELDVSAAARTVTVVIEATDDVAGINGVSFDFGPSDSGDAPSFYYTMEKETLVTGNLLHGRFEQTITIPRYSVPGFRKITELAITDKAGKYRSYSSSELDTLFPEGELEVEVNNAGSVDTEPPAMVLLDAPTTVDVSDSSQTVTWAFRVSDIAAGFSSGFLNIYNFSTYSKALSFSSINALAGDAVDGTYQMQLTLPQFFEPGNYIVTLSLTDAVGNEASQSLAPLIVENSGEVDDQGPELVAFSASPQTIVLEEGPGLVEFTLHVTDDLSGLQNCSIYLEHEEAGDFFGPDAVQPVLVNGTLQNGEFLVSVEIPEGVTPGVYQVVYIGLSDGVTGSDYMIGGGTPYPEGSDIEIVVERNDGPARTYEEWLRSSGQMGASAKALLPVGDLNFNGIPNLIEYALAMGDDAASYVHLPELFPMAIGDTQYPAFQYTRSLDAADVIYELHVSTDFGEWVETEEDVIPVSTTPNADGLTEEVIVRLGSAITPENQKMLRLVVKQWSEAEQFALIPAGSFSMGDSFNEGGSNERPVHTVFVSAFYMGRTEVTFGQWREVRIWGLNNGYTDLAAGSGKSGDHPVHNVSWNDVVKWCNAASERNGLTPVYRMSGGGVYRTSLIQPTIVYGNNGYRLPTEAEWEKAARGGLEGKRFPWGNTISHSQANYYATGSGYNQSSGGYHPSYNDGTFPYTALVGSFEVNGFGLYDMTGNVWEWCNDWFSSEFDSSLPSSNPQGPSSGLGKVFRGGGWYGDSSQCRVSVRDYFHAGFRGDAFGFRMARRY